MTLELDDLPFAPPDTTPVVPTPRKCPHPKARRIRSYQPDPTHTGHDCMTSGCDGIFTGEMCGRCGHVLSRERARAGRNSRARGGAGELEVARALGGRKMGPLNLAWDVEMPGYARLQVRKYSTPESLRKIAAELAKIGSGAEMPGYVWLEPGRGGEKLIIFRLADFAERHGAGG